MVGGAKGASWTGVRVFVEGGGGSRDEQTEIRRSFSKLLARVLGDRSKPTVAACGGRSQAFRDWKIALTSHPHDLCLLLVDSEGVVGAGVSAWGHVRARPGDGWERPSAATDEQLHFMVQTMEAWLIADPAALETYYGNGFRRAALPPRRDVEAIPKPRLQDSLDQATKDTTKGQYTKSHGFALIGLVDPEKLRAAAPHAARFFDELVTSCERIPRNRR